MVKSHNTNTQVDHFDREILRLKTLLYTIEYRTRCLKTYIANLEFERAKQK